MGYRTNAYVPPKPKKRPIPWPRWYWRWMWWVDEPSMTARQENLKLATVPVLLAVTVVVAISPGLLLGWVIRHWPF